MSLIQFGLQSYYKKIYIAILKIRYSIIPYFHAFLVKSPFVGIPSLLFPFHSFTTGSYIFLVCKHSVLSPFLLGTRRIFCFYLIFFFMIFLRKLLLQPAFEDSDVKSFKPLRQYAVRKQNAYQPWEVSPWKRRQAYRTAE